MAELGLVEVGAAKLGYGDEVKYRSIPVDLDADGAPEIEDNAD